MWRKFVANGRNSEEQNCDTNNEVLKEELYDLFFNSSSEFYWGFCVML